MPISLWNISRSFTHANPPGGRSATFFLEREKFYAHFVFNTYKTNLKREKELFFLENSPSILRGRAFNLKKHNPKVLPQVFWRSELLINVFKGKLIESPELKHFLERGMIDQIVKMIDESAKIHISHLFHLKSERM